MRLSHLHEGKGLRLPPQVEEQAKEIAESIVSFWFTRLNQIFRTTNRDEVIIGVINFQDPYTNEERNIEVRLFVPRVDEMERGRSGLIGDDVIYIASKRKRTKNHYYRVIKHELLHMIDPYIRHEHKPPKMNKHGYEQLLYTRREYPVWAAEIASEIRETLEELSKDDRESHRKELLKSLRDGAPLPSRYGDEYSMALEYWRAQPKLWKRIAPILYDAIMYDKNET